MKKTWQVELEEKVKKYLDGYSACHDYYHLDRVRDNALEIAKEVECDLEVLEAASLLHDIGYKSFEDDDANHYLYSMKIAQEWLPEVNFPVEKIDDVVEAIRLHDNYHWDENGEKTNHTETRIIQDADRIDAIGAIGMVRLTYYYGEKKKAVYSDEPIPKSDKAWLGHSLLDQINRDPMKKWENLNYDISRKLSKERSEFTKQFYKVLKSELFHHHGIGPYKSH